MELRNTMRQPNERRCGRHGLGGRRLGLSLLCATVILTGCDLSVTNPGPVEDTFLDNPSAFTAIVNGIPRELSGAFHRLGIDVAVRTRELHGALVNEATRVALQSHIGGDDPDFNTGWNEVNNARWAGDDAIRRMTEQLGDEADQSKHLARAYLWTGYAYRMMAEFYCEVTVDGGPAIPSSEFLKTAADHFGKANEIGVAAGDDEVATAGLAGRASVLVHLGEWEDALADAGQVPTDFVWNLNFYRQGDAVYYNGIYWYGTANEPYRALTTWNTPYEEYFAETGDPRTPWQKDPDEPVGTGSIAPWGVVPWYKPMKYESAESPVRLSSGREMRLIEAEALLRDQEMEDAMNMINGLRADVSVSAWPDPSSLEEAWGLLKRERGIELWLEGRRLADLRRWNETNTPGQLTPHELGTSEATGGNGTFAGPDLSDMALCVGIPNSERDTNPNLTRR